MNSNPTDLRRLRFDESVRSPNWVFIAFGALLGLFAGLLTGLPISGVLEGTESIIFYAVLGVAMLIVLFVMLNFLALLTTISDHGLEFRARPVCTQILVESDRRRRGEAVQPAFVRRVGNPYRFWRASRLEPPRREPRRGSTRNRSQRTGTHLLRLLGPPRRNGGSASTGHRRTPLGFQRSPLEGVQKGPPEQGVENVILMKIARSGDPTSSSPTPIGDPGDGRGYRENIPSNADPLARRWPHFHDWWRWLQACMSDCYENSPGSPHIVLPVKTGIHGGVTAGGPHLLRASL